MEFMWYLLMCVVCRYPTQELTQTTTQKKESQLSYCLIQFPSSESNKSNQKDNEYLVSATNSQGSILISKISSFCEETDQSHQNREFLKFSLPCDYKFLSLTAQHDMTWESWHKNIFVRSRTIDIIIVKTILIALYTLESIL